MSIDIVTPFDFEHPSSSLPPFAKKFDLLPLAKPKGPSVFKQRRAQSTTAERPLLRTSPVDQVTNFTSSTSTPTSTPILSLARSSSFGSHSALASRTESDGTSSSTALSMSGDYLQVNALRSGKPKKIKIIDWRQPDKTLDIDEDSVALPSIDRELRKLGERQQRVIATKRKDAFSDNSDGTEESSSSLDQIELWARNRRKLRAAAVYNDDTADPLAVQVEVDDIAAIIDQMEDF